MNCFGLIFQLNNSKEFKKKKIKIKKKNRISNLFIWYSIWQDGVVYGELLSKIGIKQLLRNTTQQMSKKRETEKPWENIRLKTRKFKTKLFATSWLRWSALSPITNPSFQLTTTLCLKIKFFINRKTHSEKIHLKKFVRLNTVHIKIITITVN